MEEKNKKVKKGNKNKSKITTKKVNTKKEVKQRVEVKETKKGTKVPVTNNEMTNLIKIVLIVTAIFLIFYGITTLVTDKDNNDTNPEDVVIQYDEILLGTLFEQSNSEYYVLVTAEEDYNVQTYSSLVSSYKAKENSLKVYTSNLDNGFNKSYKAEETKISNDLKELKLKSSALLKIKDKNIAASYEGSDITSHLNSLLK